MMSRAVPLWKLSPAERRAEREARKSQKTTTSQDNRPMNQVATTSRPSLVTPDKPRNRTLESFLTDPKVVEGIKAVAGQFLSADRMLRIVTFALRKTPKLAECDPQSFLGSVMTSAALGLEPNTPQGHAYLIPYDKRGKLPNGKWGVIGTECQFIIGYRGFIELAYRNPNIVKFTAKAIHQNDEFDHCEGSESFLRFKTTLTDRGPLIGAFSYAKYSASSGAEAEMSVVLPLDEIYKARAKSETFNFLKKMVDEAQTDKDLAKAQKKLAETPWVMWEDDMAAKTTLRKLAKVLPIGGAFSAAATIDEHAESGRANLAAMADPAMVKSVMEGESDITVIEHQPEEEMEDMSMSGVDTETGEILEPEPVRAQQAKPQQRGSLFNGEE